MIKTLGVLMTRKEKKKKPKEVKLAVLKFYKVDSNDKASQAAVSVAVEFFLLGSTPPPLRELAACCDGIYPPSKSLLAVGF